MMGLRLKSMSKCKFGFDKSSNLQVDIAFWCRPKYLNLKFGIQAGVKIQFVLIFRIIVEMVRN